MSADQIRQTPTGSWTVTDAWGQPPCHSRAIPFLYGPNGGILPSTAAQSARLSALRCHHRKKSLLKSVPTVESSLLNGVPSRVPDTEPVVERPPGDQQNTHMRSATKVRVGGCVDSIELMLRKEKKKKKSLTKTSEKPKVDWKKVRRRLKKTIYSLSEADLNLLYRLYQVKYKDSAPQVPIASYDNLVELFWREANGTLLSVTKLFNLLHVMKKVVKEMRHKGTKRSSAREEQNTGDQSSDSSTCVRKRTPSQRRKVNVESDSRMFCTIL